MILCHKCSGVLANADSENTKGLRGCGCISGWVRGFEPEVDRDTAVRRQIMQCFERADLYTRQDRAADWVAREYEKAEALFNLL